MRALVTDTHRLLDDAEPLLGGRFPGRIDALRQRLDGPLRVAIAGKVKAGKSTLLNALIGEKVAPTDASECTRIVTWYRNSHVYRVTAIPWEGEPVELPMRRTAEAIEIDLESRSAEEIRLLDVEWPSERLRDLILIDTPGLGSTSPTLSERSTIALATDDQGPGDADAVIYLMRHLHPQDVSFLEAFRDTIAVGGATVNALAVISRADEIGSARPNALLAANRVAERCRGDPRIDMLCQDVVAVAGLIAETAASLREDEAAILRSIAALPREQSTAMLLSVQRFMSPASADGSDAETRARLLDRLGLFGVRLSVELFAAQRARSTGQLAAELERRSGIVGLRRRLHGQFAQRASVLKVRSVLATVAALADLTGGKDGRWLRGRVRDVELGAHELIELRLLTELREDPQLLGDGTTEARRLLGEVGADARVRLGLDPSSSVDEIRRAAVDVVGRWRTLAEDPFLTTSRRVVVDGVIRSCESIAMVAS